MTLLAMGNAVGIVTAQVGLRFDLLGGGGPTVITDTTIAGPSGGTCYSVSGSGSYAQKNVTAHTTGFVGISFRGVTALGAVPTLISLVDGGGNVHLDVTMNASGSLTVSRNGTALYTTTFLCSFTAYQYVDFGYTISDTVGVFTLRRTVNGVLTSETSGSSLDTRNAGTGNVVAVRFGQAPQGPWYLDSYYICDDQGSAPHNTFLNPFRIVSFYPDSVGTTSGFTPSTGANWSCVTRIRAILRIGSKRTPSTRATSTGRRTR